MLNNKKIKSVAHYSRVQNVFLWTLYTTLLDKGVISEEDVLNKIDKGVDEFKHNPETVEALKQLHSLIDYEGNIEDRIKYLEDIGML